MAGFFATRSTRGMRAHPWPCVMAERARRLSLICLMPPAMRDVFRYKGSQRPIQLARSLLHVCLIFRARIDQIRPPLFAFGRTAYGSIEHVLCLVGVRVRREVVGARL